MPQFNPTGFQIKNSEIVTSPAKTNTSTYFWNPLVSGYSGDMLCQYLTMWHEDAPTTYNGPVSGGYVYPVPAITPQPAALPVPLVNPSAPFTKYNPTLGVAQTFKYFPKGAPGWVETPNYLKSTQLEDNTWVEVNVICDPFAQYDVQTYLPQGIDFPHGQGTSTEGFGGVLALSYAYIIGLEYEQFDTFFTANGGQHAATFYFVKGNATSNYNGGSGQGITVNDGTGDQEGAFPFPFGSGNSVLMKGVDLSIQDNVYNTLLSSAGPAITYSNPIVIAQQAVNAVCNSLSLGSAIPNE